MPIIDLVNETLAREDCDKTCISVFESLKDEVNRNNSNYLGIIELDETSKNVPGDMGIVVDSVAKSDNRAAFAIEMLNNMDAEVWDLWKGGYFYLMGNAKSIKAFRKAIKEKGVQSKNIYTQPFWADGKVGL